MGLAPRPRHVPLAALATLAVLSADACAQVAPRDPPHASVSVEHTAWPRAPGAVVAGAADATDLAWRWWLRRGPAQFGVGVGAVGLPVAPPGASPSVAWSASTLTFGLRWRLGVRSTLVADAADARPAIGADRYATRLGVEWAGRSPARFGFERGAFGVRLDSGYRMSLRLRHGGLALYLRGQF